MDNFSSRHIGPRPSDVQKMVKTCGFDSLDDLIYATIPDSIRSKSDMNLPQAMTEHEYLEHIAELAGKNKVFKSYIGTGYNDCLLPSVIKRNILENAGWYTAYTPYQAEISQGRLEALLNFQTMVIDLTGLEIANASLLDEATAAAEAMIMFYNSRSKEARNANANKFFISSHSHPQNIAVVETRAIPLGIEVVVDDHRKMKLDNSYFGALLQYPSSEGNVFDYSEFVATAKSLDVKIVAAADILSLALLTPPGEWGADAVVGTTQRFGIPLGFGGPHAAYFSTKEEFKRHIPGRIIGVSIDSEGNSALRMALQTREQHIKRDKATSNICTAQVLLAVMAGMYAVYHGPEGIKRIAGEVASKAHWLNQQLTKLGWKQENESFFDTLCLAGDVSTQADIRNKAENAGINFRYYENGYIGISVDETTKMTDLNALVGIFGGQETVNGSMSNENAIPAKFTRKSAYMTHPVFSAYHSETEMMRYIKRLENKDLSLNFSMIPLGSCTMKLNAASELLPLSWAELGGIHPFAPADQAQGYMEMLKNLENYLTEITGLSATSLQPNSGAQGEYAGLMVIRAYHESRGDLHRDIALIPSSAHGTNPASAVMAGMQVVVTKTEDNGNIDLADIKEKAEMYKDRLSCLMVTYPSTHGVFEEDIKKIIDIVHENGGQVYMDGANMNAQVGLTSPGEIGADVCHLNLHKTFAIPHGGGGPGMGPICVASHLAPFLPSNPIVATGGNNPIKAISAAPFGSALVLVISYGYIRMLGHAGLTQSTKIAILNANYLKSRLTDHYDVLYKNKKGMAAHEMILECREFKKTAGIEVTDIAKRLMDYGFHAPTVSFPVAGTIMVEPTESESLEELDRFVDALISIRKEISEVETGIADAEDNVLKNAPHIARNVMSDDWNHSYSRKKAAYPLKWVQENKFWPSVKRVDNAFGDRNLVCACPPTESYEMAH
ncbi:MAG TPA: glycine dehydrogenase (aminomethyl-transferring) [Flavobacteriales bacterium]|nr:glycine dehydrogenase (aminomethyl-transferring) [Flavobacteriales bacterium]